MSDAADQLATLEIERDHFRTEMWKVGRILAVVVDDAGGELVVATSRADELGDVMLDFAVDDDGDVTVTLENAPAASAEASTQQEET